MQVLPPALAPLAAYKQFILYRLVPNGAKTEKKPVSPHTLMTHDPHDPAHWVSFEDASAMLAALGPEYGVGFVFTAADPFWFLDIDGGWDGTAWSPTALQACEELAGAAVEVSSSGRGLHLFGTGFVPPHGSRNGTLHTEFYTDKRFVALTGLSAVGDAGFAPANIGAYVQRHFPVPTGGQGGIDAGWWSDEPVPQWRGPEDDEQLTERAMRSRSGGSVFGGKACFSDLWDADADKLGSVFPPDRAGDAYNASTADAALAQHLCFWTGNDAARIERLMRQSALLRDKWDDRDDYLPRTIRKACSMQDEFLNDAPPSASPFDAAVKAAPVLTGAVKVTESTFLGPEDQVSFFAGCVYVIDQDKFMLPTGMLVDATRFNRVFGGRTFVMDSANERTTRKAAEVFTESQAYRFPRVDSTCFRPLLTQGAITVEAGRSLVNTWVPVETPRVQGDVSRFWSHLERMFPDENDRNTIFFYMAGCVQLQGRKFQWAPLVQGMTGNGKSMLSKFVRKAIGAPYCHTARAKGLDNDFNAWMSSNTFVSIDETYVPEKRMDILETLKEMITSDEQEVTPKGVDSAMREICCNFMFFTNHKDGLRKNRKDRRIAPFFCPQQTMADLERDGFTERYFTDYVDWLEGRGAYADQAPGYACISHLLWTVAIPDRYNPSKHPRAPKTTSTEAAILASRGPVEQEILEAIEQEEMGFKGGWVSSVMLKRLLSNGSHRIGLGLQGELLEGLGYVLHPALLNGRTNNVVTPDAAKPKLYVLADAVDLLALETAADVSRAYSVTQMGH